MRLIMATLKAYRPDDAVLSEEGADDLARLDADRVWIVDPLDGTREFSEPPRDDWAIHVALWERGAGGPGECGRTHGGCCGASCQGPHPGHLRCTCPCAVPFGSAALHGQSHPAAGRG